MINTIEQTRIMMIGLKEYIKRPIIMLNQDAEPPKFPYLGYNITAIADVNNGTYSEWDDDIVRKPYIQTYSFTSYSDDYNESVTLINKTKDWLDYVGTLYLNDNHIIIQSIGNITDRSNLLTNGYIYSYGFDCFVWVYDEIEKADRGQIETVEFIPPNKK